MPHYSLHTIVSAVVPVRSSFSTTSPTMSHQPPAIFTAADCVSSIHSTALDLCPKLAHLYSTMGIDDSNVTFLLYELHQHVTHVFNTTYKEAEDERQRLILELEQQSSLIPILARELDDHTALIELASIGSAGEGLKGRAEAVRALYNRLNEVKVLSGKVITEGLKELNQLYREVGVEASEMLIERDSSDYSGKKVQRIKDAIAKMQSVKAEHTACVNERAERTLALCDELGVTPDEFTLAVRSPQFVISEVRETGMSAAVFTYTSLLACIDKRLDRLTLHKQHQQQTADRHLATLHALWSKLDMPSAQTAAFMSQVSGQERLSESTMRLYMDEIARLERLKAERMVELVQKCRADIQQLWDRLHFTQQQQLLFRPFFTTPHTYDDAFLALHETERDRLTTVLTQWRPILSLWEKRCEYRAALSEFEIASSDPDRLVSRGRSNYLLLKEEEKMRNMRDKGLPKVEQQLVERVVAWEAEHRERFMLDGVRLLDTLRVEMEEWKANAVAKKKAAEEARSRTQLERQSMIDKKPTGSRATLLDQPHSAGKQRKETIVGTPRTAAAGAGATSTAKRQLMTPVSANSTVSAAGGASTRRPVPLFDNRGGQFGYGMGGSSSLHSTPTKEIAKTTPVRTGIRTPKTANKENSSM